MSEVGMRETPTGGDWLSRRIFIITLFGVAAFVGAVVIFVL